jgi:hypothetical protein
VGHDVDWGRLAAAFVSNFLDMIKYRPNPVKEYLAGGPEDFSFKILDFGITPALIL